MDIGGQALVNGVLFRNKKWISLARRKEGKIVVAVYSTVQLNSWQKILSNIPIVRGLFCLFMMIATFLQMISKSKKSFLQILKNFFFLFIFFIVIPFCLDFLLQPMLIYEQVFMNSFFSPLVGAVIEKILTSSLMILMLVFFTNLFYPRLFAYHGAEHKVINAYEKNKPLLVQEARLSSRLHPRCGTGFLAIVFILDIFILTPLLPFSNWENNIWIQLFLFSVVYEIMFYGKKYFWLRMLFLPVSFLLQRIVTTKEPDDNELEVALAALNALPEK